MNKWTSIAVATGLFALGATNATAIERCFSSIDGVQIVEASGVIRLYVYSSEFGGSNYMTYAGSLDVLKAFHAQFLYARATEQRVCATYTEGSPSYVWNLSGVAVARPNGYPFE